MQVQALSGAPSKKDGLLLPERMCGDRFCFSAKVKMMDQKFKPYRTGIMTVKGSMSALVEMAIKEGTTFITSADATVGKR